MLRELHIANLAVIEDAHIQFAAGLNCFTGQTGAGKSLIMGALQLLLGHRPAVGVGKMVRSGANEARISAVFELRDAWTTAQVADAADQPLAAGEELLITRKISSAGRSSASVNGRPSTAGIVRRIGELLVDIHGQRDHQYLLQPANQLLILDRYARAMDLRERYAGLYRRHQELVRRAEGLAGEQELRRHRLELYTFEANEIDDAAIAPGEYAELKGRSARLSNAYRIKCEVGASASALYDSEGSIVERLQMIVLTLQDLVELEAGLEQTTDLVRTATLTLEEAARDLTVYTERVDCDQAQLAGVEDRLNVLNRLIAKYGDRSGHSREAGVDPDDPGGPGDPGACVLGYRGWLEDQLRELRGQDKDVGDLREQIAGVQSQLDVAAVGLNKARRAAAKALAPRVEAELRDLGMGEAKFSVAFDQGQDKIVSGPTGRDRVEMLVQLNPGQAAGPLRSVASGGELSRVMLAIKSILADDDRVSVLVFDEIDANIGGRLGTVIGSKLRALSGVGMATGAGKGAKASRGKGRGGDGADGSERAVGHQVLCITHLPQIAAFADRHLSIQKTVSGGEGGGVGGGDGQTRTSVTVLDRRSRVAELAAMLAGTDVTATTRKQARELIQLAGA